MNSKQLPEKPNKCGECTLCCYLLPVPELNKKAQQNCVNCIAKKGCKIWATRPQVCRDFKCAYYQMDKVQANLRPDKSKIIFEKVNDRIFHGTQDPRFKPTKTAKNQVMAFRRQGISVIIVTPGKGQDFFIAPGHNEEEIRKEFEQVIKGKYDSS